MRSKYLLLFPNDYVLPATPEIGIGGIATDGEVGQIYVIQIIKCGDIDGQETIESIEIYHDAETQVIHADSIDSSEVISTIATKKIYYICPISVKNGLIPAMTIRNQHITKYYEKKKCENSLIV